MRLLQSECQGILIDVQERLFPYIFQSEQLLSKLIVLLQGLQILQIPLIVSEQYKKGLGTTIRAIKPWIEDHKQLEKISFSCLDNEIIAEEISTREKKQVIIFGIEMHICVLQTCLDLKQQGFEVYVIADACGSRKEDEIGYALRRLQTEGVFVTSVESVLFELCRDASSDKFKAISKLMK